MKRKSAAFPWVFKHQSSKPCAFYHFVRTTIRQQRCEQPNSTIPGKKKCTGLVEEVKPESQVLNNYCCTLTKEEKQHLPFCSRWQRQTSNPRSLLGTGRNFIHVYVSWRGQELWQGLVVLLKSLLMWCFFCLYVKQCLFRHWLTMAREGSAGPALLCTEEHYDLPWRYLRGFPVLFLIATLPNYPVSNVPGS